ncbi:hypothetical protein DSL72_004533 [Monilinia vaccinii-corymbosi]|uniref:Peptidase S54 rhomboid domain-containing protein n=1 Tax=Monilinia vaccinii-corymbosi TaxID=61207 RepID=A0A8A3NWD7_9HELO|nr:hypothetical protein DSL72_004533 [Monilinia vaccinii-corymbosi]
MEFHMRSRLLGLHMRKMSGRPIIQIAFRQISSDCMHMTTQNFSSLSIHASPLVRKSSLLKVVIPPSRFRRFFSPTPLACGSQHRDPASGEASKRKRRQKQLVAIQPQNQRLRRPRDDDDDHHIDRPSDPSGRRYRKPRSSYPLAVLIAVGCTYITLSFNRSPFTEFPLPSFLPKFTPSYLEKNFILSQKNIDEGRIHTLITNSFMHASYPHLFMNMLGLLYIAPLVSPLTFVAVWAGAGIACSLASLYTWKRGLHSNQTHEPSTVAKEGCGASGSICGLITMTAIRYPSLSWQIMFIPISFPGWLLVGGEAIYSILALNYGWHPYIGHAGHLGGTAFGLLASVLGRRFGWRGA